MPQPTLTLRAVPFTALPGWGSDDARGALAAFTESCAAFRRQGPAAKWALGPIAGTNADWLALCDKTNAADARSFFEQNFAPVSVTDGVNEFGLFTGYFEPELKGSRTKSAAYPVPLYKRPLDLVTADLGLFRDDLKGRSITGRVEGNKFVPYPARAIIEAGALAGKKLEILWVDDPVEAFFLQVQGSGKVTLDTGETIRVGYDAQNGQPYRAIGRDLVAQGVMPADQVTLDAIVAWLHAHPADAPALMNKNPSYVFFREIQGRGPLGAQGVPLTPGRSLAVDHKYLPYGAPVWLDTTDPTNGAPLRRLLVAQDTGGAISGMVRGDLFWGSGPAARAGAGAMKQQGKYYVLVPRTLLPSG